MKILNNIIKEMMNNNNIIKEMMNKIYLNFYINNNKINNNNKNNKQS